MATLTTDHTHIAAAGASLSSRDVADLLEHDGQLVDLRSPDDFARDAFPGAVNLPLDAISWRYRRLNRWRPVILYGNDVEHCHLAAVMLAAEGFSRIYYLTRDQAERDNPE